jgi:hypothetical protein
MSPRKSRARKTAPPPALVPALRSALTTANLALEEIGHAPSSARKTKKKTAPATKRR